MHKQKQIQFSLAEQDIQVDSLRSQSSELLIRSGVLSGAASCYSTDYDETWDCCQTKLNGKVKVAEYASDDPFDTRPTEYYCHHSDRGKGDWN